MSILRVAAYILATTVFQHAFGQNPENSYWSDKFGYPGLTGVNLVQSQRSPTHAVYKDTLYLLCFECEFGQNVYSPRIIKYYNGVITPFRPNSPLVSGVLYCMSIDSSGAIYLGGDFDSLDGKPMKNIAKWDGIEWVPLGSGLNASAHTLACSKDDLYVSGPFDTAGGVRAVNIARWDGDQFSAIDTAIRMANVSTIIAWDSVVILHGLIQLSNNQRFQVRIWDHHSWKTILVRGMEDRIRSIGLYEDQLYIAGSFDSVEGVYAPLIAKFDGQDWTRLGTMIPKLKFPDDLSSINTMEFGGDFIFCTGSPITVGGETLKDFYRYDGKRWTQGTSIMGSQMLTVGRQTFIKNPFSTPTSSTFLFTGLAEYEDPVIIPFLDSTQHGINPQNDAPQELASDGQKNVYVRYVRAVNGVTLADNDFAVWNGSAWSVASINDSVEVATPNLTGQDGNLYVFGHFQSFGKQKRKTSLVAKWDGSEWYMYYDSVFNGLYKNQELNFQKLYVQNSNLIYALGYNNSKHRSGLFRWSNGMWSEIDFPDEIEQTPEMYCFDDTVMYFAKSVYSEQSGNTYQTFNVYKWDTHTLTNLTENFRPAVGELSDTLTGRAYTLAYNNGKLYVGGYFSHFGSIVSHNIIAHDGDTWQSMGSGCMFDDPYTYLQNISDRIGVRSIVFHGDDVYVSGQFSGSSSLRTNSIARWDGEQWFSLGSGVTLTLPLLGTRLGEITGMTVAGGQLFIIGEFSRAGNKIAHDISSYSLPPKQSVVRTRRVVEETFPLYPNPSDGKVKILLDYDAEVTILDMLGRHIHQLEVKSGEVTLDCSALHPGCYEVMVRYDTGYMGKGRFILH